MQERQATRTLDELGRIVLPADFRKTLGWDVNDEIVITLEETHISLKKPLDNN